ncbi:glycosyltransferase family 4 protein [Nostoc sp. DedQUE09]|uniref:glycosyltransferase family 4 protein n=1 Tax=Nostoc sp. DedQUE09 TaxID=3075394 RepID=UPI002AD52516|nr:glycosyltransferase family 4 protein [Nostoc sp. DedQUE09]MDZ7949484.1 glycosyltransferase family 4 protein [Nostoc sp. DedQUE09]
MTHTLQQSATIALMPCGALFEDYYDTINVSFETLRTEQTGTWMFNYIDALKLVEVQTVLFFVSGRVNEVLKFRHEPTGATVCILPAPRLHQAFRKIAARFVFPKFKLLNKIANRLIKSLDSYFVLPVALIKQELKQENCCAILFQDYHNPSFDVCVFLGRMMQLPVFATFQGGIEPSSFLELPTRLVALHLCQGLIIASQTEAQIVHNKYWVTLKKVSRIFNPIDTTNWRRFDCETIKTELGIPLEAKVIIYHGRIEIKKKGLDVLLDAWKKICHRRPDQTLRLLLVGTGTDAPSLQQKIVRENLRDIVWINEYIRDRNAIQRYLSAADVYTLPSRHEGFPVAPLEAMASSLPVVATNVQGIPEIFESGEMSGGLIVPIDNVEALAAALESILDNEVWAKELGRRARERVERYFSLESIGQQMRSFLLNQDLPN